MSAFRINLSCCFQQRKKGLTWRKKPSIAADWEEGHDKVPWTNWKKQKKSLMYFKIVISSWE